MLKVPTYKDLNINIKKILWTKNYKSFTEFQKAYSGVFCAKLGHYLSKHKANTKTNFLNLYQIIFYQGFINYNREKELLDLLTYKDYIVKVSGILIDAIIGVDLIATRDNITYLIQVKPSNHFINLKHIKAYGNNHNYKIVLAFKQSNK